MKLFGNIYIIAAFAVATLAPFPALAFSPSCPPNKSARSTSQVEAKAQTRGDFLSTAVTAAITSATLVTPIQPAYARGRATLEQAYDRYTPRIIEGGQFYKGQLYGAISKGDWKTVESATAEPPKKSKEDRKLQDGGIAKRAALAGGFSDSRVLTAMDLFAATFSESSIAPKTKAMKAEVEKLREVVQGLNKGARIAQGEEKSGGGLFGIGGKAPSQGELTKELKDLYLTGGNAYNQYVFVANDGLPVQLKKLPFL
mmetsp:Transcript_18383/g.39749  ORF Transcript_18383/g.39749 Transcript_18383/m.39749 type:complete len:256 (-) Transcript_18383:559-1326(-)|eukprot:CAMPEP_0172322846 /NCGR_PEP_ID=MMETSP1058-20130122/47064_1 /TAXON_ID=83371 /ORGANISM="Detonula confervacea, Strain CCMP 353" /LENGTH=255 /DNA_ID=CAMNT_0013038695 /DNA_START=27 /DNA_END=794 /DNA_ORIENTATION=-